MSESLNDPLVLGAGPVGRTVAESLVERGCEPTVVTRSSVDVAGARSVIGDVSDADDARRVVAGASVVFQCAGPPYHRWVDEFPALQRSVLGACAAAGAPLIAAENVYGYGDVKGARVADTPMNPASAKGEVRAKMWDEVRAKVWDELLAAHNERTVPTAAVRASDFFGPGVVGSVYGTRFFDALAKGRKAEVLGSPGALHSITYVPDFGRALVAVAADPTAWGRAWHAPTAAAVSQRRIVEITAEAAGGSPKLRAVPTWQLRLMGLAVPEVKESIELLYQFESDFVVDSDESSSASGSARFPWRSRWPRPCWPPAEYRAMRGGDPA